MEDWYRISIVSKVERGFMKADGDEKGGGREVMCITCTPVSGKCVASTCVCTGKADQTRRDIASAKLT